MEALRGAGMCLMLASALHSIAVGNLLPARVRTVCVDMTESVPVKLSNRGTMQAIGLVTDVGFFLERLERELRGAEPAPRRPDETAARFVKGLFGRRASCPRPARAAWPALAAQAPAPSAATRPSRGFDPIARHRRRRPRPPRRLPLRRRAQVGRPVHRRGRALRLQQRLDRRVPPGRTTRRRCSPSTTSTSASPTAGTPRSIPQTFEMLRGRAPTVDDYKRDVGRVRGARPARRQPPGPGCPCSRDRAQPPHQRPHALPRGRARGPPHRRGPRRGHVRQLRGADHALGHRPLLRGELPGPRAGGWWTRRGRFARGGTFDLPGGHYGWVVEIDPYDPGSTPREAHRAGPLPPRERRPARRGRASRVAGYMGDDRVGGHVWKFVSDEPLPPGRPREQPQAAVLGPPLRRALPARTAPGEWRLARPVARRLDPNPDPADPKPFIPRGARTLADCYDEPGRRRSWTPTRRPTRSAPRPPAGPRTSRSIPRTAACSSPSPRGCGRPGLWENIYGEVWRIEEDERRRALARASAGSGFAVGRARRSRARPAASSRSRTTCVFDRRGDLWLATDIRRPR